MTREEAIELLVNATYSDEWQGNEQLTKANLMAIEALQAEPVKHGEWVLGDGYYCSSCGYKLQTTAILRSCPNCGAKMDKE